MDNCTFQTSGVGKNFPVGGEGQKYKGLIGSVHTEGLNEISLRLKRRFCFSGKKFKVKALLLTMDAMQLCACL